MPLFFFDKIKDQSAKQIADLMTENTRVKVCAKSSTTDQDSVREEPHEALEQNSQLQNELQEHIVKHQELKKTQRSVVRQASGCKKAIPCWNTV